MATSNRKGGSICGLSSNETCDIGLSFLQLVSRSRPAPSCLGVGY
jgi:hypothetical protein